MTIIQKIESSDNNNRFTLFKEGLNYRYFNENAMVFVQRMKEYKVSAKFVKSVEETFYRAGLPVTIKFVRVNKVVILYRTNTFKNFHL